MIGSAVCAIIVPAPFILETESWNRQNLRLSTRFSVLSEFSMAESAGAGSVRFLPE